METLSKEELTELYTAGNETVKTMLMNKFGKKYFEDDKQWMELWDKFCKENNITITLPYSEPKNNDEESANAYMMLIHIIRIRNNGWQPDWNNSNEYKFYPWFNMRTSSGSGFAFGDCGDWNADSAAGSRLCFKSEKLAKQTANEFLPIYEKYITK